MARNIVPPDGVNDLTVGTKLKRWLKGFFGSMNVANGALAPVNTLQRSTEYAAGDVVQSDLVHAKYHLVCTTAGTTGSAEPNFANVAVGDTVTDGTAVWTVCEYSRTASPTFTGTITADDISADDISADDITVSSSIDTPAANVRAADKAPINTLQRSTAYAVGDILYTSELHAKFFLKCTTAGTTDTTAPSFSGVGSGDTVTDGTAKFTVQTVLSLEEQESKFVDDLLTALQTTGSLPAGTAFGATTLLSKIIANMNTQDGVQYNLTNSSAWYICLGAKYGNLIIQGGRNSSANLNTSNNFTFAISFANRVTPILSYVDTSGIQAVLKAQSVTVNSFGCYPYSSNTGTIDVRYIALGV